MVVPTTALLACTPELRQERAPGDVTDAGPAADGGSVPSEIDAGPAADATPSADATITSPDAATVDPCAMPMVESWSGAGSRDNDDGYPDHITATITWTRTGTDGCVDTYAPSGSAQYGYAIPGALCDQSIDPDNHAVVAGDGVLTIDRTTSPTTYSGSGATYWTFTFRCEYDDGTFDESQMPGGGIWFDASGTVAAGAITGTDPVNGDDDPDATARCGPNGIAPCTYSWSFTAN